jgi:hypothetical protein
MGSLIAKERSQRGILFYSVKDVQNSTSGYTLRTLYRSYFYGIAYIELQVYSVTCC